MRTAPTKRRTGGAKLVPGDDPSEHDGRVALAECLVGEALRRRHGSDPVEAVEHFGKAAIAAQRDETRADQTVGGAGPGPRALVDTAERLIDASIA